MSVPSRYVQRSPLKAGVQQVFGRLVAVCRIAACGFGSLSETLADGTPCRTALRCRIVRAGPVTATASGAGCGKPVTNERIGLRRQCVRCCMSVCVTALSRVPERFGRSFRDDRSDRGLQLTHDYARSPGLSRLRHRNLPVYDLSFRIDFLRTWRALRRYGGHASAGCRSSRYGRFCISLSRQSRTCSSGRLAPSSLYHLRLYRCRGGQVCSGF